MILFVIFGLTIIKIPYEVKKDYQEMEFYYSSDGKDWDVIGVYQYPHLSSSIKDTFRWYVKGNPKGDIRIKVVYASPQGSLEKEVEDFKMEVKDEKGGDYFYYGGNKGFDKSDTTYSWRMLGYDAQHTGYYPHPLYPPLELRWVYGEGDPDYTMVSSSAGNGMLYTRCGTGQRINWVSAIDIETGEVVWERELTSNVWTTVLSPGDSLLFVGTSIGWDSLSPTFYCLDPFTGDIRWSKFLHTVEYSPVVTDTIVYAPNLYGGTLTSLTLWGKIIWQRRGGFHQTPSFYKKKIYGGDQNSALLCLDAYTGETLWVYPTGGWIDSPCSIKDSGIYFFSEGYLYSIDAFSGRLMWRKKFFGAGPMYFPIISGDNIYFAYGIWNDSVIYTKVRCVDRDSGNDIWEGLLEPINTEGGRASQSAITSNGILWISNVDYIYRIEPQNGGIMGKDTILPGENRNWPCWYFPVFYNAYLMGALKERIFLYQGRTTPLDTLNITDIIAIPNPFLSQTQIIANTSNNTLLIYDLMGRKIKEIKGDKGAFGYMYFIWDGRDAKDRILPSGVYFGVVGSLKQKLIKIRR